jgi:hypothetical protein
LPQLRRSAAGLASAFTTRFFGNLRASAVNRIAACGGVDVPPTVAKKTQACALYASGAV